MNISNMPTSNKRWLIIGFVLLAMILTNPSMKDFEDYNGAKSKKLDFYDLQRPANYLLFSIYDDGFTRQYIGIFKNFFPIGNSKHD